MSLTVVTAASTHRLCRVDDVLAIMPEDLSTIEHYVDAASASIMDYCGVEFAQQRYQEIRSQERGIILQLEQRYLWNAESVMVGDQAITDYRIEQRYASH